MLEQLGGFLKLRVLLPDLLRVGLQGLGTVVHDLRQVVHFGEAGVVLDGRHRSGTDGGGRRIQLLELA